MEVITGNFGKEESPTLAELLTSILDESGLGETKDVDFFICFETEDRSSYASNQSIVEAIATLEVAKTRLILGAEA